MNVSAYLSVYLSVRTYISGAAYPNFTAKFSVGLHANVVF